MNSRFLTSSRLGSFARPLWIGQWVVIAFLAVAIAWASGCTPLNGDPSGKGVSGPTPPKLVRIAPVTPVGGIGRTDNTAVVPTVAMAVLPAPQPSGTTKPAPTPADMGSAMSLAAAANEWVSLHIELGELPPALRSAGKLAVRVGNWDGPEPWQAGPGDVDIAEVVDVPADMNKVSQVRHAGQTLSAKTMPRALVPLKSDGDRFAIPVTNTAGPTGAPSADLPLRLWIDLKVPASAVAGMYAGRLELLAEQAAPATGYAAIAALPLNLQVHGFALPAPRKLKVTGLVSWEQLVRHWPDDFEATTPHLVSRGDRRYEGTVRTLDALQVMAQHHRVGIVFDRLQPVVKWPALVNGAPPDVRWDEFDEVVSPWMTGTAFADGVGIGGWFIPEPDNLASYDGGSRLAYWERAAAHFDRKNWLQSSPVWIRHGGGRPRADRAIELSIEAAQLLGVHQRLQVSLPLEPGQVQVADPNTPPGGFVMAIDPRQTHRLWTVAPGLIAAKQDWSKQIEPPKQMVRADLPGLVRAAASGNEHDVRLWAWLAYLREAEAAVFSNIVPTDANPAEPADPADMVWFYPGRWFGRPDLAAVPSMQLKWMRQGQQDYEYLRLAKDRGEWINTRVITRLMCKQVTIGVGQAPDDAYAMVTGTTDAKAWSTVRPLLAKLIQLRPDGKPTAEPDPAAANAAEVELVGWCRPQERPILTARTAQWAFEPHRGSSGWLSLNLGMDLYTAADIAPGENHLQWRSVPPGWQMATPRPVAVPVLVPYQILPLNMEARVELSKLTPASRRAVELELKVDSTTASFTTPLRVSLPVAPTDRRAEGRFSFDGKLDDWSEIDQIHDGPLVKLQSRPAVLAQRLEPASKSTQLYTNWHNDNLYVAFSVDATGKGVGESGLSNFVNYQARRAWGEDLCQVLVQPIYSDNSPGPLLHLVLKPNGSIWVERRLDPKKNADPWEPYEGTGTRYAAALSKGRWTGELAIPWKVLAHPQLELPRMLRFNFMQHRHANGESASWAGPIDFGRDDALTGILYLPVVGSAGEAVQGPKGNGVIER